jgi:hypothetical protein
VTASCKRCAEHPDLGYRRFIAALDLGHDATAHRIYWRLHCDGVTIERLAELSDGDILSIRTLGAGALARIRTRLPCPTFDLEYWGEVKAVGDFLVDAQREAFEDLLGCLSLYVSWRFITKQLTTEQKELFADAHDAWQARLHADDPYFGELIPADRWWRE